jgi:transposase InsO family protein
MTDRGVQFDAAFFKELCAHLRIKPAMTTTFHPQANGGTEQVNREVQLYLSIFCINNLSSWSQVLKKQSSSTTIGHMQIDHRPHSN